MQLLRDDHCDPGDGDPDLVSGSASDELDRYLQALIAGDRVTCEELVDTALAGGVPLLRLYEGLMKPALYRIGELWVRNQVSVACEHMATTITEGLLNRVYATIIPPRRCGRKVVLATVEDELHQVGLKMVGDLFEMHGWDARLSGAGVSIDRLLALIARERPDAVGLSFSVDFHANGLEGMVRRICAEHPELPILIGGQGLTHGGHAWIDSYPSVIPIAFLDDLSRLLQTAPPWTCGSGDRSE